MKRVAVRTIYVMFHNEIPFLNETVQIKRYKLELKSVQVKNFKPNYRPNLTFMFLFVNVSQMIDYRNKPLITEKRTFIKKEQFVYILLYK